MEVSVVEAQSEFYTLAAGILDAAVSIARRRSPDAEEGEANVTRSQLAVLTYLHTHGTCAMLDLAAGVGVTAPTMTSTIKILVRKGLVDRQHAEHDWRTVLVTITEIGVGAMTAASSGRIRGVAKAIESLPPEHRAMIMVALPALRELGARLDSPS
jgi:DNA-binding MarR family transcriptional regulator